MSVQTPLAAPDLRDVLERQKRELAYKVENGEATRAEYDDIVRRLRELDEDAERRQVAEVVRRERALAAAARERRAERRARGASMIAAASTIPSLAERLEKHLLDLRADLEALRAATRDLTGHARVLDIPTHWFERTNLRVKTRLLDVLHEFIDAPRPPHQLRDAIPSVPAVFGEINRYLPVLTTSASGEPVLECDLGEIAAEPPPPPAPDPTPAAKPRRTAKASA